ncbi:MAG: ChbG/HpnK family deacetylase [Beijerinckiaceae bacterium]
MQVILSADDFGYCADTLARTIACFDEGVLTGASIMAQMPESLAACAYAKANPQFSFGVHLVYCDGKAERPLCPAGQISSLVDERGRFHSTRAIIARALTGRLNVEDIERETFAQIARVADSGVALSYVDGHGNLHKFPPFVAALRKILPHFGIDRVRRTQNVYLATPWTSPNYWLGHGWNKALAAAFKTTSGFYLSASRGDADWAAPLWTRIANREGAVEIGVHPGAQEPWRAAEEASLRAFAELLRQKGVKPIGWKDLS